MLTFYVYILQCSDGSYYVGHTENIELRLSEHKNKKYSGYTSTRLPINLVFHQPFACSDEDAYVSPGAKTGKRTKGKRCIGPKEKNGMGISN